MNFNKYLPANMCRWLNDNAKDASDITIVADKCMYVSEKGFIKESPYLVTKGQLADIVTRFCGGSIYANQNTLKSGFITVDNGCRVGVTGTCVYDEKGSLSYLHDITAINIRIPREIAGASNGIMKYIYDGERVYNLLIVSPPSAGKTTVLRDIAKNLGSILRVGIVDERSEIANGYDMGKYTFAVNRCTKPDGILMLLRSMAPQVVLTDEIGGEDDEAALEKLVNAGIKIICTAHGYDENDVIRRGTIGRMIENGIFERIVVLSQRLGPGTFEKIVFRKEEKND